MATLDFERYRKNLMEVLLQSDVSESAIEITADTLIQCRLKYAYSSLEAGKPITCILRINNRMQNFPLTISLISVSYLGSNTPHEILRNTIQFNEYHELHWQVLVQKSGKFGIDKIEMGLSPSGLRITFDRHILFKK